MCVYWDKKMMRDFVKYLRVNNYRKMHHLPMRKRNKKYKRTRDNFWRRMEYNNELKYCENDAKVTKEVLEYYIHSNMEEPTNVEDKTRTRNMC